MTKYVPLVALMVSCDFGSSMVEITVTGLSLSIIVIDWPAFVAAEVLEIVWAVTVFAVVVAATTLTNVGVELLLGALMTIGVLVIVVVTTWEICGRLDWTCCWILTCCCWTTAANCSGVEIFWSTTVMILSSNFFGSSFLKREEPSISDVIVIELKIDFYKS